MRGGNAIRPIRKRMAGTILFVFLAVMMLTSTALAKDSSLVSSARKLSGGTWVKNSKGLRYRRANGSFIKNAWILVSGKVYRIGADQYAEKGWFTCGGNRYYADSAGRVYYRKWLTLKNGNKYYFPASGICVMKRWHKIGENYYYFNKNGKLLTNRFIGDYYVDASGVRLVSSWVQSGGKKYYLDGRGKLVRNMWIRKNGKFYYMLSDGTMAVSCQIGDYFVDKNGVRQEEHVSTPSVFRGRYIFVGDSRMVGMSMSVSRTDTAFVAEVGMGYYWLKSTALAELEKLLKMVPDAKVILALGVNDLGEVSNYISCYRKLAEDYPRADFHVLSVTPVDYEKAVLSGYGHVTNEKIMEFNRSVQAVFGNQYIDAYTYLEQNGFETNDGLHYLTSTYQKLFNYIISQVR